MLAPSWCLHPPPLIPFRPLWNQTPITHWQEICVVSPCPSVQFDLFNAHPYYLPRWLDGFYCQLDLSSPVLEPYLELVATSDQLIAQKNDSLQPKEPAGSKTGRVVKALQTDTVIAKEPLKGTRHSQP